jgi:hypothetical protein
MIVKKTRFLSVSERLSYFLKVGNEIRNEFFEYLKGAG